MEGLRTRRFKEGKGVINSHGMLKAISRERRETRSKEIQENISGGKHNITFVIN